MKRFQIMLAAAVVLAVGSAFTTVKADATKGTFATYHAVYADASNWTWSTATDPSKTCQATTGRYCTKVASSQPAPNTPGDDLGNQYR